MKENKKEEDTKQELAKYDLNKYISNYTKIQTISAVESMKMTLSTISNYLNYERNLIQNGAGATIKAMQSNYDNMQLSKIELFCNSNSLLKLENNINLTMDKIQQLEKTIPPMLKIIQTRKSDMVITLERISKSLEQNKNVTRQIEYLNVINDAKCKELEILNELNSNRENNSENSRKENIGDKVNQNKIIEIDMSETAAENMQKFLGYTKREDINVTPTKVYESSIINENLDLTVEIIKRIKNINVIYNRKFGKSLIEIGNENFEYMMLSMIRNNDSEEKAKEFISNIYIGIYENSFDGGNCMIYSLSEKINTHPLDIIKWIRQSFQHENYGHKKDIENYFYEKTGKYYPIKPKEWLKFQNAICHDLYDMICEIDNKLDKE